MVTTEEICGSQSWFRQGWSPSYAAGITYEKVLVAPRSNNDDLETTWIIGKIDTSVVTRKGLDQSTLGGTIQTFDSTLSDKAVIIIKTDLDGT